MSENAEKKKALEAAMSQIEKQEVMILYTVPLDQMGEL